MNDEVTRYISQQETWKQAVLTAVRRAVHAADPDIGEYIKWGAPSFEHGGAVVWVFCAAEWVHVSFPQGVLLEVPDGTWEEGADTQSQAKRTIKFREGDKVPADLLQRLVKKAVANNLSGNKVTFNKTKAGSREFDLPHDYETLLKEQGMLERFLERPYYQQKGWVQWIEGAKHEETRQKRTAKMLQELEDGTYMPAKKDTA